MNARMENALRNVVEDEKRDLVLEAERIYEKALYIHRRMMELDKQVDEYKARRGELVKVAGLVEVDVTVLNLHAVDEQGNRIGQFLAHLPDLGVYRPGIQLH